VSLVWVYSGLLLAGLALSQVLPAAIPGPWAALHEPLRVATMFCLAFIMIRVGFEFTIEKLEARRYAWDYVVAAAAAAFPWLLCAAYFVWAMSPSGASGSWDAWRQSLLIGRFSAPTSAGLLFAMLAAAGLSATWVYKKARILAIFDDLDTVLLMIPLKMMLVGLRWQLAAVGAVILGLVWFGWRRLNTLAWPARWPWALGYAAAVTALCELIHAASLRLDPEVPVHLEVLLPAFVLGCVISRRPPESDPGERRAGAAVTSAFLVLVGLSMPVFTAAAPPAAADGLGRTVVGGPWPGWPAIALHVLAVTFLSNLGKMFSLFCYRREASLRERLAVSVAMWPRGEVGAGVLAVSLSYGLGGPAVTVAMLSLALNLACTGFFIAAVRALIPPARVPPARQRQPVGAPPGRLP
jgi:Kef-type K+ transport system membrane component KefB